MTQQILHCNNRKCNNPVTKLVTYDYPVQDELSVDVPVCDFHFENDPAYHRHVKSMRVIQ